MSAISEVIRDVCLKGSEFLILMPEIISILDIKLRRILQITPDLASRLDSVYMRELPSDA